jgi:DNA-binding SARP family transcriptional activator/nucleoid-associated protein YgaU
LRPRIDDLLKGLGAVVLLAVLLIGVPAALIGGIGWPLPSRVPELDQIRQAASTGSIADGTILKFIAVVVWCAWLQVAVAALSETAALLRRRTAAPAPLTMPGIQLLVGRLLSTALLLTMLLQPKEVAAPALRLAVNTEHVVPSPSPITPPQESAPTWTVKPRETLWGIAEKALGDGRRFQEIADLNRGRLQPDGATFDSPHVIRPGWVLQLPGGTAATATRHEVRAGESLSTIAAKELGDADRWPELWELNRGRSQPDGESLAVPNHIEPGWALTLPGAEVAAAPGSMAPAAEGQMVVPSPMPTSEPPAPTSQTTPTPTAAPATGVHPPADDDSVPLIPIVAGTTAAGLVALLARRRRVTWRHRKSRALLGTPSPVVQEVERRLHEAAQPGVAARIEAALRAASSGGAPAFERLEVTDKDLRLKVSDDARPPDGFAHDGDGVWLTSLDLEDLLLKIGDGAACFPALVQVGVTGDTEVFLDLEQLGVLALAGDDEQVTAILRGLATAAAAAPWASSSTVVTVGLDVPLAVRKNWQEAAEDIAHHAEIVGPRLAGRTAAEARADGVEGIDPLVVVGISPPAELVDRLHGPGVAVVLGGVELADSVHLDESGRLHVPGVDTPVVPTMFAESDARAVGDLLEDERPGDSGPEMDSLDPLPTNAPAFRVDLRDPPTSDSLLDQLDVLVRVFGSLDIAMLTDDGERALHLPRQKAIEAVAYLACRDRGVPVEDVRDALWPSGSNSLKTLQNVVSEARSALGTSREGDPLLPLPEVGSYHLSERVGTDHDVFRMLVQRAADLPDEQVDDVACILEDALKLVQGEPFVGVARGFAWVTHQRGALVAEVVDAAEELAEIRLAEGDWRAAEWAARQGLRAFPCDERLYRLLMRSAHAAGNIAAVQRVFDELCAVVADPDLGVEPEDTVHPETLLLLDDLMGTRRSRALGA